MRFLRRFQQGGVGLAVLVLCLCTGSLPKSIGRLQEVTIITDYWNLVSGQVKAVLEQPVFTPQPEPEFLLRVGGFDRFPSYSRMRIVFLIGTVRDSIIRGVLGGRADSLGEEGFGLFKFPNAWVDNQQVLLFVARDTERLIEGLRVYGARLYRTVTEMVLEQMTAATYFRGRDDGAGRQLARFGFSLDVPKEWLIQDKDSAERFIYIHGHFPDRSVFVHWQDTVFPLVSDSVLQLRDRLTAKFYDGDYVDRNAVRAESIEFLGVPCLRIRGVWQNQKQVIGGPFVLYAFNYQERFFLLDGMVFNPGEKKVSSLFQVEAIIRTFLPR
ncbi:MAG: DUF4837 family protein [candidate division WOR-3 bacterium]